jgi:hypothetical protein
VRQGTFLLRSHDDAHITIPFAAEGAPAGVLGEGSIQ